jgi:hypothetical protein
MTGIMRTNITMPSQAIAALTAEQRQEILTRVAQHLEGANKPIADMEGRKFYGDDLDSFFCGLASDLKCGYLGFDMEVTCTPKGFAVEFRLE